MKLRCRCGHEFWSTLINGTRRTRCPYCSATVAEACEQLPAEPDDKPARAPAPRRNREGQVVTGIDPFTATVMAGVVALLCGYSIMIYTQFIGMPGVFRVLSGIVATLAAFPLGLIFLLTRVWSSPRADWAVPCVQCGGKQVARKVWTFWGGYLITRMFDHVQCYECGCQYNGGRRVSNYPYAVIIGLAIRVGVTGAVVGAAISVVLTLFLD